ncbi:MAG: TIGR02147 family protein, partial [Deltaproteobacteria bacterium]|nr:TIGR02147 family protein [Deltaproteobacteria bacterium]
SFLKDWHKQAKESRSSFSFRNFAKKAGFQSSNFVMLVMQGKRNLGEESVRKFVIGLDLNKQQEEFFRDLVFFNQAKTHKEKDHYYKSLLRGKQVHQLKPMEKEQYEYYSEWYHPVVRELVNAKEFDGTPEWIAKIISPEITPAQAAKSLELLEKLGFIQRAPANRWKQTASVISTGPELRSIVVHNYHKKMLDLTKSRMDELSASERDTSAMTLGIKQEKLGEIKEKINRFRKEILEFVSDQNEPDTVVQFNMQFFPVTKTNKGKKEEL